MFNNDESTLSTFSLQKKTVIKIQVCFMHWSVWNTLPVGTMWHKLIMHKNLQYGCTWCESFASAKRLSWIGMSERFVLKLPYYLFILEVPHVLLCEMKRDKFNLISKYFGLGICMEMLTVWMLIFRFIFFCWKQQNIR